MKDPYKEVFDSIGDAIAKLNKVIFELAARTLTIREYQEFVKMFNGEKKDSDG